MRAKQAGKRPNRPRTASDGPAPSHPAAYTAQVYTLHHALVDLLSRGMTDNAEGTKSCYQQRAGHLVRLLGESLLAELHIDDLQRFVDKRIAEGAARETVRKELCVFRRAVNLAGRRGIECPDAALLLPRFRTRYNPRKQWLTREQFEELLGHLDEDRAVWLLAAVYLGCRLSELEKLRWEDVAADFSVVHVRGTKTAGSDRLLPIHPRLGKVLRHRRRAAGPVLPKWHNVRRDLTLLCRKLGIPKTTPNDLRRTFASWLVQAGESSFVVAQLLGHSSSTMVERVYGRLAPQTLRTAISKLPKS